MIRRRFVRRASGSAVTVPMLFAAAWAGAGAGSASAAGPGRGGAAGTALCAGFVERPGVIEFSGRLIVRPMQRETLLAAGWSVAQADALAQRAAARIAPHVQRYFAPVDEYVVSLPAGLDENACAAMLLDTGDYEYAHPDWICHPLLTPNDPFFSSQWHHQKIKSPQAWDVTTGSASITCAVVDTGVDLNHADLKALLVPGYNSVSGKAQVDGGDVSDVNGHGTATSGTAVAIGNNAKGVAGVGWNQRLMMIRTTNNPDGTAALSNILEGARWGIEHGAKVASASYGGVESPSVQTTGAYIKSIGGLLCYAAGNDNEDHAGFDWPDVIVVGATTPSDAKASFSSYGKAVDLYAPGVDVWTTYAGGGYGPASGTSFSTPMVNGVASMIWSVEPSFSPKQVELMLYLCCDDLGPPGEDDYWGFGRVNLLKAVQLATQAKSPAAPVGVADAALTAAGVAVAIDVLANDYDLNGDELSVSAVDPASSKGGTLSISKGSGPEGRDEIVYLPAPGYFGADTFGYTVSDDTGLTGVATVTVQVDDPATYRAPDNPPLAKPGAHVSYFVLPDPTHAIPDFATMTPYASEIVPKIDYPPTVFEFAGSGLVDLVGAVYTGYIEAPKHAYYTFFVKSSDGAKLFVGDALVVDHDGQHGPTEKSGTIALQQGAHAFRLEFIEIGGSAALIVSVSGPGIPKAVADESYWLHTGCPEDVSGDGAVGQEDLGALLGAYGTCAGDAGFNPLADLDGGGCVDQADLGLLLAAYGQACP